MFAFNRTLNLDAEGLGMFLSPYQRDALIHLYEAGSAKTGEVWRHINRSGAPDPKSRTSVIQFLKAMAEEDLVAYTLESGKGGYYRVYHTIYPSLEALERELVRRLLTKVAEEFNVVLGYRWLGEHNMLFIRGEES